MCCIMRQCFDVDNLYRFWLGLTILAQGWDVTMANKELYTQGESNERCVR
jgi:hypothetical protein